MANKKLVGERIRELRKSYNLNQTDFAKPLGVSYGHISNLEKGKDLPSDSLVKLMAYEYNTTAEWILQGEGDMFTHIFSEGKNNMKKTNELFILLDDVLCSSPSSIRKMQENILESIILLLQANSLLVGEKREAHLDILKKVLESFYLANALLHITKEEDDAEIVTLANESRIDDLLDDIYSSFSQKLDDFRNIYIDYE